MGQLSVLHLGAIGLATMIFNFFFWNFGFLRMGTTGMVAQAYGREDINEIQSVLSKGVYLGLAIAAFILVFQKPIGHLAIWMVSASEEHSPLIWTYFNIRIWGAPATMATYCLFGWLFGMQNASVPMIVTIATNLINIIMSYYFVINLGWSIEGVAYGTIIAEYFGLALLVLFIIRKYRVSLHNPLRLGDWTYFLAINRDLFIRTVALTSAFIIFYRQSSLAGPLILATNVILLQFLSWMTYGVDGFAYASQSLSGKYYGGNDRKSLTKAIELSFLWGFGLSVVIAVLYGFLYGEIGTVFTSDKEILFRLEEYRLWLIALPFLAFSSYIWDGVFIGLILTKYLRDSMLIGLILYIFSYILLAPNFTNAIWISFAFFLFARGALLTIYWYRSRNQIFKNISISN